MIVEIALVSMPELFTAWRHLQVKHCMEQKCKIKCIKEMLSGICDAHLVH